MQGKTFHHARPLTTTIPARSHRHSSRNARATGDNPQQAVVHARSPSHHKMRDKQAIRQTTSQTINPPITPHTDTPRGRQVTWGDPPSKNPYYITEGMSVRNPRQNTTFHQGKNNSSRVWSTKARPRLGFAKRLSFMLKRTDTQSETIRKSEPSFTEQLSLHMQTSTLNAQHMCCMQSLESHGLFSQRLCQIGVEGAHPPINLSCLPPGSGDFTRPMHARKVSKCPDHEVSYCNNTYRANLLRLTSIEATQVQRALQFFVDALGGYAQTPEQVAENRKIAPKSDSGCDSMVLV